MKFIKLIIPVLLATSILSNNRMKTHRVANAIDTPTTLGEHVKKMGESVEKYKKLLAQLEEKLKTEKDPNKRKVAEKNLEELRRAIAKIERKGNKLTHKVIQEKDDLEKAKAHGEKVKAATMFLERRNSGEMEIPDELRKSRKYRAFFQRSKTKGVLDLAKTCQSSFFENVPPSFCWKKGADVGIIPTACPPGFFRHLALCFQNCEPGYSFDGGALCIKQCPSGTTTYPLTCTHWSWKVWEIWTIGRSPYFPKSITNFEAPCPEDYYKGGALCYRDCNKIGLDNCGIGMCASDSASCASGITSMVTDFLVSLGKTVSFVLSFGATSAATQGINAAKQAAKTGIKQLAKGASKAIKAGMKLFGRLAKSPAIKNKFLEKVKKVAFNKIKQAMKGAVKKGLEQAVSKVCGDLGNKLLDKGAQNSDAQGDAPMTEEKSQSVADQALGAIDVLGVGDVVKGCGDVSDGGLNCAGSVLRLVDNFDPTGLAGMAAAFMQPVCDV